MKKILLYLILITVLTGISNNAVAVYVDDLDTTLLLHCDTTNQVYWLITPDDNSSGRDASTPILDRANDGSGFDITASPELMTGSPKGGNFFRFDGTNDSIYCTGGWQYDDVDNLRCDFSIRWLGLPPTNNFPLSALVQAAQWRCFLTSNEDRNQGYILFLTSSGFFSSTKMLDSNIWYDVHFNIIDEVATLIVGDTTNSTAQYFNMQASQITVGVDIYEPDNNSRYFNGDLDEIRVGDIPEPYLFTPCYLLFAFVIYHFKQ